MAAKKELRRKYQDLNSSGKLHGTIKRAMELREKRETNQPVSRVVIAGRFAKLAEQGRFRRGVATVVPLGDHRFADSYRACHSRLREWSLGEIAVVSDEKFSMKEIGSNSDWKKKSTFQRGVRVQSFATCVDFRVAIFRIAGETHDIKAPRGYRWDIDSNGLFLRSRTNSNADYHPTATELLGSIRDVVASLKDNLQRRKDATKKAKQQKQVVKKAEAEGATVCLRDSIRAGNCSAGSQNWARNNGLNPARHYQPTEILSLANGDASRVAIVIAVAMKRHREEMKRGYAHLSDHR